MVGATQRSTVDDHFGRGVDWDSGEAFEVGVVR
jgi:hypothetical protein